MKHRVYLIYLKTSRKNWIQCTNGQHSTVKRVSSVHRPPFRHSLSATALYDAHCACHITCKSVPGI